MGETIVFYVFAALAIASATQVVMGRNPVTSALSLVVTFFSSAIIWMLLEAEFLGISLVLVYVGAVMVLFLFVVMMLDIDVATMKASFVKALPIGGAVALAMLGIMVFVLTDETLDIAEPAKKVAEFSNVKQLGAILYSEYVYPIQIAAVILLVAIVASIGLTMRRRPQTKYQTPGKQVQVVKADRLKVVKVEPDTSARQ